MKRYIYAAIGVVMSMMMFSACTEDALDKESIITIDKNQQVTDFDRWLKENYVNPYNIEYKYRYEDKESDMDYYEIPAEYNQAVVMAHLLKYLCLEAYDEVGGILFTRAYFPKLVCLSGEFKYNANNTMELGSAEGGKKITLTGVNYVNMFSTMPDALNNYYFSTIHHEFAHILNQTKDMPVEFKEITGSAYLGDQWNDASYSDDYLQRGFITAYAQKEYKEDFAEVLSQYVIWSDDTWNGFISRAGAGAPIILQKLALVKTYMQESWNIDIDDLRHTILRREADVAAGKIDLSDLSVE